MEIVKVVSFAFIALFIVLFFREKRQDIAVLVSVLVGVVIFLYMISKLTSLLQMLEEMSIKANLDFIYVKTVFKILGIAYIASFCSEICKDAGENSIAAKVEFSGKIFILILAIPILMAVMQSILKIL